jgi:hypothetical protein
MPAGEQQDLASTDLMTRHRRDHLPTLAQGIEVELVGGVTGVDQQAPVLQAGDHLGRERAGPPGRGDDDVGPVPDPVHHFEPVVRRDQCATRVEFGDLDDRSEAARRTGESAADFAVPDDQYDEAVQGELGAGEDRVPCARADREPVVQLVLHRYAVQIEHGIGQRHLGDPVDPGPRHLDARDDAAVPACRRLDDYVATHLDGVRRLPLDTGGRRGDLDAPGLDQAPYVGPRRRLVGRMQDHRRPGLPERLQEQR